MAVRISRIKICREDPARSGHPLLPPRSLSARAFGFLIGVVAVFAVGCGSRPPAAPAPQTAFAIVGPAATAKPEGPILKSGIAVDRDLSPDGRDEIPLDLKAGDYVRLSFEAGDLDLDARLLGPGETASRVEGSTGYLSAIAKVEGRYRFALTSITPRPGATTGRSSKSFAPPRRVTRTGSPPTPTSWRRSISALRVNTTRGLGRLRRPWNCAARSRTGAVSSRRCTRSGTPTWRTA